MLKLIYTLNFLIYLCLTKPWQLYMYYMPAYIFVFVCLSLVYLLFVCMTISKKKKKKKGLPVSLWAEVTHQMAGPEQRTCIGAKRCEEDSRSLHIALQSHKAHWDIHCCYVIGVPLRRQPKQTVNWCRREHTELYDQWQASKLTAKERLEKMHRTNKTCMKYVHNMYLNQREFTVSFTTFSAGIWKLIYFYTLTELKAKHW